MREGQAAVFIHEGQLADVFGPGLYMLETNNMPILTTLQHWDHGFQSPFKSEIYFVNTTRFNDQKWGTKNPIMARDPEFGPVRLRAFGTYSMRVTDPGKFITEIVGTDGEFTSDEISFQIRNVIVQSAAQVLAKSGIPVLDMAANLADLGKIIANAIAPQVAEYGLSIPEFYIENISLPEEVEKALDKRTSIGVAGDLNKYMQFNAAEAMDQPGSAMGAAMGAGMGMGMGAAMAQNMPGPGARHPLPLPRRRQPRRRRLPRRRSGIWPKTARPSGPFGEADLAQAGDRGPADAARRWSGPPARTAGKWPPKPTLPGFWTVCRRRRRSPDRPWPNRRNTAGPAPNAARNCAMRRARPA